MTSGSAATDAILGVNAFWREVSDKIELDGVPEGVNEVFQEFVDEDIEATVWINNPNEGEIWGVEFDLSTPVSFISPNLHVFANYTYLDSEILDANENFPVEHRFSQQPDYVYNVGFDHLIEPWGLTWGASYQKRGEVRGVDHRRAPRRSWSVRSTTTATSRCSWRRLSRSVS